MTLKYLDKAQMTHLVSEMWKRKLDTNLDPTNGRWLEKGADGKDGGLLGGLVDYPEEELKFDKTKAQYDAKATIYTTAEHDNTDGLSGKGISKLSHTITDSIAETRTKSNSIKVGAGIGVESTVSFIIVHAGIKINFSVDYAHSWSNSKTETRTESRTFEQSVEFDVPAKKKHVAYLTSRVQTLHIPYKAIIRVKGFTDTWFEHPVQDRYRWRLSASEAIAKIGEWGIAGTDSPGYTEDGIVQEGILTAQQAFNFSVKVVDVTDLPPHVDLKTVDLDDPSLKIVRETRLDGERAAAE